MITILTITVFLNQLHFLCLPSTSNFFCLFNSIFSSNVEKITLKIVHLQNTIFIFSATLVIEATAVPFFRLDTQ